MEPTPAQIFTHIVLNGEDNKNAKKKDVVNSLKKYGCSKYNTLKVIRKLVKMGFITSDKNTISIKEYRSGYRSRRQARYFLDPADALNKEL